ncbi:hypothetical protein GCM10022403_091190 [Streptomyces coacervatus]|uniref:Uncharacterized protein n=1 Tax=Streptomyces coacervatus TaxID=647381 RepID=A0ABP7JHC6_9ACTN|nr:hypothetical protein [Streptomyces coacervatus]MDF2271041.1 hypothetical protein [Streptomyces coacervatus]
MTQSGQGEEPSPREAREGIVLPSDGGEPLLPGMLGAQGPTGPQAGPYAGPQSGHYGGPQPGNSAGPQAGPYNGQQAGSYGGHQTGPYGAPQTPAAAPPGGQAWGTPWGPDQQQSPAPPPGEGWPTPPAQAWGAPDQQQSPPPDQWGAPASGALPTEGAPAPSYGGQPAISQPPASPPLPPADPYGASAPGAALPPAGHGGPAAPLPPADSYGAGAPGAPLPPAHPGAYGPPAISGGFAGSALPPAADDGATQYIPPVAAVSDMEGATQYIPPVAPGALPPEVGGGGSVSEGTQFLGHAPHAVGPDSEATQYIPPVTGQAPYGMPQGGDRQPPAEFDNLFRSAPGGESPAQATQQLPRFQQPPQQAAYAPHQPAYAPPGDDGGSGRGGRSGARVPLIAAIGIGIVVLGVGAGAMLSGGGGDGKDKNQTVSATAPATDGSASSAVDAAKQQAVALDKLLADSGSSRASVIQAVASVKGCNNLGQAASDLRGAAKQRTELVTRLSGLSVDKLPNHAALTTALTKAWQASAAADNHYAAWADQVGGKKGCRKSQARATGQTRAGNAASGTASQQKVKAAQLWNAIAKTYGLNQRQPVQL